MKIFPKQQYLFWSMIVCLLTVIVLLLQPLRWCCVDCMIHHQRDVREEQKYMYVARTSNNRVIPMEWSWLVTSDNACELGEQLVVLANGDDENDLVGWSLLLLAATVRSFAHMPLGISDRNTTSGETSTLGQGVQIAVVGARVKTVKLWRHRAHSTLVRPFCNIPFLTSYDQIQDHQRCAKKLWSVLVKQADKKTANSCSHSEPSHL